MAAYETDRLQLRCPECERVVATVPVGYRFRAAEIRCPYCGHRYPAPGTVQDPDRRDEDTRSEG